MQGEFDHPTFADLRLVLRISQGGSCTTIDLTSDSPPAKKQCTGLSLEDAQGFYVHRAFLASKSPVIKAMLLRAKELRDLKPMGDDISIFLEPVECCGSVKLLVSPPARQLIIDPQPETLELPVEQEELLACEVLFRSLYSDDLAEEVASALSSEHGAGVNKATLLVQLYRLADRLEVCTDQCAQAISSLSSEDCQSVDAVNYVFSLKGAVPGLVEHATIKALMEMCMSQLVERFGAVWRVVGINSLVQEFKQLDFLTVLAFFKSDGLEILFSENEILILMAVWMGKDWSSRISKEQLGAFLNVLRLGDLSTSFIANLSAVAPWLPVHPAVLGHAVVWKSCQIKFPGEAVSMPKSLQSIYGSSVAWFKDKRKHRENGVKSDYCFSKVGLAQLLTMVQHAGALENRKVRGGRAVINGYDITFTLSVQIVSDGSKKTFVLSVGFEFRTSAYFLYKVIKTLAYVKANCVLGKGTVYKGSLDKLLHGEHSWEVARVDSLDDFSCLDSYLNEEGKLPVQLTFLIID